MGPKTEARSFGGAVLANMLVEYTDRAPKHLETMLTFWPAAAVTHTLPQFAALFVFKAMRSKDWLSRSLYLLAATRLLRMLKGQFDSRNKFMRALEEIGVSHSRVKNEKIGSMTPSRIAGMLLSPLGHVFHHGLGQFSESNGVRVATNITFSRLERSKGGTTDLCKLKLDVLYSQTRDMSANKLVGDGKTLPVLIYIHGGGWAVGNRQYHSLPVLMTLARAGWAVVTVDYRLANQAKLEGMILDCKTAVAWVRLNIADVIRKDMNRLEAADKASLTGTVPRTLLRQYPENKEQYPENRQSKGNQECPLFVAVAGESAGGQLACMIGLTGNQPAWQPKLPSVEEKHVDTSVSAVVDLYGVHDMTDSDHHFDAKGGPGFRRYIRYTVIRESYSRDPNVFLSMSPTATIREALKNENAWCAQHPPPPFFGVHGSYDSLVPVEDAESFYESLKACRSKWNAKHGTHTRDALVVVDEAPHAFNNSLMPWTFALGDSVAAFLHEEYDVHTCDSYNSELPSKTLAHLESLPQSSPKGISKSNQVEVPEKRSNSMAQQVASRL